MIKFNRLNAGHCIQSLKVILAWAVIYVPAVFVFVLMQHIFSEYYIIPVARLEEFEWIELYANLFYGIVGISLFFNAFWIFFILPFSKYKRQLKRNQFLIGFVVSWLLLILLVAVLWGLLNLEVRGLLVYGGFCVLFFPVCFILSRFFTPVTYKYSYWFKELKINKD